MLFYVRRHTGADGSFEWYVLNGHTRRRASKFFPTRAAAAAERKKLQVKLDLAKEQVLRQTPKGSAVKPTRAERGGASTNKAGKGRKSPHPVMAITAGTSQGELIHTQNQARTRLED